MDPQYNNKKGKFKGNANHDEKLSRALSSILRHRAVEVGLDIDAAGWIKIKDILAYLNKNGYPKADEKALFDVTDNNDKKRFQIQQVGKHLCIRATQGHTMRQVESQALLKKITDPTEYPVVIHGTYMKFWDLIKKTGLKAMSRNHIHFAPGMPEQNGVISGMRRSCDIYIIIDMEKAMKDKIDFYISSNNVILTEGVGKDRVLDPKYFKKVITRKGNDLLKNQAKMQEQK